MANPLALDNIAPMPELKRRINNETISTFVMVFVRGKLSAWRKPMINKIIIQIKNRSRRESSWARKAEFSANPDKPGFWIA